MVIYISGKITGTDDYMERFAEVEKRLKLDGHRVINPAKRNAHFPKGTSWETYMRSSIRMLTRADAIYLLRDWRRSPGARLEHSIAVALDMVVLSQAKGE
jgi:hypothetical protein